MRAKLSSSHLEPPWSQSVSSFRAGSKPSTCCSDWIAADWITGLSLNSPSVLGDKRARCLRPTGHLQALELGRPLSASLPSCQTHKKQHTGCIFNFGFIRTQLFIVRSANSSTRKGPSTAWLCLLGGKQPSVLWRGICSFWWTLENSLSIVLITHWIQWDHPTCDNLIGISFSSSAPAGEFFPSLKLTRSVSQAQDTKQLLVVGFCFLNWATAL